MGAHGWCSLTRGEQVVFKDYKELKAGYPVTRRLLIRVPEPDPPAQVSKLAPRPSRLTLPSRLYSLEDSSNSARLHHNWCWRETWIHTHRERPFGYLFVPDPSIAPA